MKKKAHFRIAAITAILTFGTLAFAKGAMYKHYEGNHIKHFDKAQNEDSACNYHFWHSKKNSNQESN